MCLHCRICSDQLGLGNFDISHAIKLEYFDEDYVLYCMYLERLCCEVGLSLATRLLFSLYFIFNIHLTNIAFEATKARAEFASTASGPSMMQMFFFFWGEYHRALSNSGQTRLSSSGHTAAAAAEGALGSTWRHTALLTRLGRLLILC